MMRYAPLALLLLTIGCGGDNDPTTRPTPTPAPTPSQLPTFLGAVVDTVSGASIQEFTAAVSSTGARVTISAAGYITREAPIQQAKVDLIKDGPPFSLAFYRILARNGFDAPMSLEPLRRQAQSPSFYIRTVDDAGTAIDPATLQIVERAITNDLIAAFSGGTLGVAAIERGSDTRVGVAGWITVSWPAPYTRPNSCGFATIGGGSVALNNNRDLCGYPWLGHGGSTSPGTVKHEIGHAMGFYHTGDDHDVMSGRNRDYDNNPSDRERYHAAIVYKRPVGSRDVDVDPGGTASTSSLRSVVID